MRRLTQRHAALAQQRISGRGFFAVAHEAERPFIDEFDRSTAARGNEEEDQESQTKLRSHGCDLADPARPVITGACPWLAVAVDSR